MVFDKEKNRPEERIATQFAKWDEAYRARQRDPERVRPADRRRLAAERLETTCRTAFRALWLRDYARLDVRLTADGEVWFIEANANPFISYGHDMAERGREGRDGLPPVHPAAGGRSDAPRTSSRKRTEPDPRRSCAASLRSRAAAVLALLPQLRPRAALGATPAPITGAECYRCGWMVSDTFSWCPWCGVDIYEEGRRQRGAAAGAERLPARRPLRLGLRRRRAVPDGVLSLVRPSARSWNEDDLFEGNCPHCAPRRRRLDEHLPLVRRRRHRARPHPAGARPRAPPAAGLAASRDWGYRVLLRPGVSGVDPKYPKIVEIEQRYVVGKRRTGRDPVDHAGRAHHATSWVTASSITTGSGPGPDRFRRAFGEVDKAYRGMDDTWVYFQRRRVAIAPPNHVSAYAAKHPQEDFAETFRFYVTRRGGCATCSPSSAASARASSCTRSSSCFTTTCGRCAAGGEPARVTRRTAR